MAHILRKYISNRGSALFMVISTMTALIISCMAMYFTMVSARSSQYAVFSQMQATQTAVSIKDIIVKSIMDPANHGNGGGVLKAKILELAPGESITTDANGFLALDPNVETGKTPTEIGAYSVTITCLEKDSDGNMKFDVLAISSLNGSRDAVHFEFSYNPNPNSGNGGEDGAGGDAELFAATGYIPNDAYISGGYYVTNVFYDTQFTYMSTYSDSGENFIGQDLYTGGDLMLGAGAKTIVHGRGDSMTEEEQNKIGPVTWAIRGNFYPYFNADFAMRGGSQILVGGDFNYSSGEPSFTVKNDGYEGDVPAGDHISVYVNGDLNYSGSYIKSNVWFFVNGKVTGVGNDKQNNARIYVTSRADTSELHTQTPIYNWPDSGEFDDGLNYTEFTQLLGQKTQTIAYYKWDLSGNTDEDDDDQHVDIRTNSTNSDWTDDKGDTYEAGSRNFIFAYPGSQSEDYVTDGSENGVVGKSFIIDSVWTHGDNNASQAIIIDTGDDPTNIMTIKLSDVTGDGVFSWFVDCPVTNWWPLEFGDPETCLGRINGDNQRLVLLRGRGTVLLDVPKGVIYQESGYGMVGHVGWWLIEGGEIDEDHGHLNFTGVDPQGKPSETIVPYIHRTCGGVNPKDDGSYDSDALADSDGCKYSYSESEATCNKCENNLTKVTCAIHGDVNKFCTTCHPEKKSRTDWCVNHVDKLKFEEFYDTLSGTEKDWVTGDDGEIVYPTTNIMLVSCDESAEMRFSKTTDNEDITCNSFFGFVYAPYMSFLSAKGAQAGGMIKLCGGMTVGDYDLESTHVYVGCYPDRMPNEIAGMEGGGVMSGPLQGTTKSWKITIGGYT